MKKKKKKKNWNSLKKQKPEKGVWERYRAAGKESLQGLWHRALPLYVSSASFGFTLYGEFLLFSKGFPQSKTNQAKRRPK